MKNLNAFFKSEWYKNTLSRVWIYVMGAYFGVIAMALGGSWFIWLGLFLIIIKPSTKKEPSLLAHGAGCEYEKALNKNNENTMEGVK